MKYTITFFICLSSILLQAQIVSLNAVDKYIEVKVSDTMMVNPDAVTLMISLDKTAEDMEGEYSFDDKEKTDKDANTTNGDQQQRKQRIEEVLTKNNVKFKFHEKKKDKGMFGKDVSLYENAYEATVSSEDIADKIKKELSTIKDVTCKVADRKISDKEKYELLLIDKVMKKAEREATVIAKAMGVTLDKPLNVSNQSVESMYNSMFNNSDAMGGLGAVFSMMGNMFKGDTEQSSQVSVSKALVVRYGIK